jgi:outer membrane lipoprotein LolB
MARAAVSTGPALSALSVVSAPPVLSAVSPLLALRRALRVAPIPRAAVFTVVAVLSLGILGCSGVPTAVERRADWTTGRLALNVEASPDEPARGFSAAFELRGTGSAGELRLATPLGMVLATARWLPGEAWLRTPDGERRFGSLDELAQAALGERVPVAALPDWLAGRPWPGAPSRMAEPGFEQLGWRVDLRGHAEGRLTAHREAPPPVTMRIRLERPAS